MIEWSYKITQFLPIKIDDQYVAQYVSYHTKKLNESIEHNIETWIFLHTHILYMTFIYIQLLRISQNKKEEFKYSRIWLASNEKDFIKANKSPFAFSKINEKTVFRFFRLIDFDDWTIGDISSCVNERNDLLHATWTNIEKLDQKLNKYLKNMEKVVKKSQWFLNWLFTNFLEAKIFGNWYEITHDDLELNLYIPYQFSEYELELLVRDDYSPTSKAIIDDLWFEFEQGSRECTPHRLEWETSFDYSNNNWVISLWKDKQSFEIKFSKASNRTIHVLYNDPKSIENIALAIGIKNISDIADCTNFDTSSRTRTPQKWEIVILKNIYWNYCAIKILDIKDRTRNDEKDEVTFEYVINDAWSTDFSI